MSYTADITERGVTTSDAYIRDKAIIRDGSTINVVWAAWASKEDYEVNLDHPLRECGQTLVRQSEDPELFAAALAALKSAKANAPAEMAYLIAETKRAEQAAFRETFADLTTKVEAARAARNTQLTQQLESQLSALKEPEQLDRVLAVAEAKLEPGQTAVAPITRAR